MAKPKLYTVAKLVHLTEDQAKAVSDFRFEERIGSENAAIRQLIGVGLLHRRAMRLALDALFFARELSKGTNFSPEQKIELHRLLMEFGGIGVAEGAFEGRAESENPAGPEAILADDLTID